MSDNFGYRFVDCDGCGQLSEHLVVDLQDPAPLEDAYALCRHCFPRPDDWDRAVAAGWGDPDEAICFGPDDGTMVEALNSLGLYLGIVQVG